MFSRNKGDRRRITAGFVFFLNLLLPLVMHYVGPVSLPTEIQPAAAYAGGEDNRTTVSWTEPVGWRPVARAATGGCRSFPSWRRLLPAGRSSPPCELPRREKPVPLPAPAPPARPRVALIIDDAGFVRAPVEAFFSLRAPLTLAVLPWGKYSQKQAQQARTAGFEVFLHLPLEPLDPANSPGPGALFGKASPDEIRRQLRANINNVPGIVGVNNHMGSKGTQDPVLMRLVMEELKVNGLFFVDSLTIDSSVAGQIARAVGVPTAERDLFLDQHGTEDIPRQMEKLLQRAVEKGSAIGIVHPRPGAAEAVAAFLPRFAEAGVEIVPVSELVE